MTEHTHTGKVAGNTLSRLRVLHLPEDWPVGAEVTVTWTEPPEPTGRWVTLPTLPADGPRAAMWDDGHGDHWSLERLDELNSIAFGEAEAALVDLIESDHLPPHMPSVEYVVDWMALNGYRDPHRPTIRGTLDAIVALAAHEEGAE